MKQLWPWVLFLNVARCVLWTLGCDRNQCRLSEAIRGIYWLTYQRKQGWIQEPKQRPPPSPPLGLASLVLASSSDTLALWWEAWVLAAPGPLESESSLSPGSYQGFKEGLLPTPQNSFLQPAVFSSLLGQTWSR